MCERLTRIRSVIFAHKGILVSISLKDDDDDKITRYMKFIKITLAVFDSSSITRGLARYGMHLKFHHGTPTLYKDLQLSLTIHREFPLAVIKTSSFSSESNLDFVILFLHQRTSCHFITSFLDHHDYFRFHVIFLMKNGKEFVSLAQAEISLAVSSSKRSKKHLIHEN